MSEMRPARRWYSSYLPQLSHHRDCPTVSQRLSHGSHATVPDRVLAPNPTRS